LPQSDRVCQGSEPRSQEDGPTIRAAW
jgi:hypothetical protein